VDLHGVGIGEALLWLAIAVYARVTVVRDRRRDEKERWK